jgi:hypothetical protein
VKEGKKKIEINGELFMVLGADKKAMGELKKALEKKAAAEFAEPADKKKGRN